MTQNDISRTLVGGLGFPANRHNFDMQLNNYGKRLLDVFKSFNLCNANGRLGGDRFLDKKLVKVAQS